MLFFGPILRVLHPPYKAKDLMSCRPQNHRTYPKNGAKTQQKKKKKDSATKMKIKC